MVILQDPNLSSTNTVCLTLETVRDTFCRYKHIDGVLGCSSFVTGNMDTDFYVCVVLKAAVTNFVFIKSAFLIILQSIQSIITLLDGFTDDTYDRKLSVGPDPLNPQHASLA